jgi:hypothetical protein
MFLPPSDSLIFGVRPASPNVDTEGSAYYRYGNSTQQFSSLDWYVQNRLCRFIGRKHGKRGIDRGLAIWLDWRTRLGLHQIAGTVRYDSAKAAGERPRRAA